MSKRNALSKPLQPESQPVSRYGPSLSGEAVGASLPVILRYFISRPPVSRATFICVWMRDIFFSLNRQSAYPLPEPHRTWGLIWQLEVRAGLRTPEPCL